MVESLQNAWLRRLALPPMFFTLPFSDALMSGDAVYWLLVTQLSCIVVTSSVLPPATDCAVKSPGISMASVLTVEVTDCSCVWLFRIRLPLSGGDVLLDPSAKAAVPDRIAR